MVIFHSFLYVYQRVHLVLPQIGMIFAGSGEVELCIFPQRPLEPDDVLQLVLSEALIPHLGMMPVSTNLW
jgi:hypothetical protein